MQPAVTVSLNGSTLSELPNHTRAGPHADMQQQHDMLSDFFGGRNQQLHDTSSLPSYAPHGNVEAPPQYGEEYAERPTLARYMFKYGFCKLISSILNRPSCTELHISSLFR